MEDRKKPSSDYQWSDYQWSDYQWSGNEPCSDTALHGTVRASPTLAGDGSWPAIHDHHRSVAPDCVFADQRDRSTAIRCLIHMVGFNAIPTSDSFGSRPIPLLATISRNFSARPAQVVLPQLAENDPASCICGGRRLSRNLCR